MVCLPSNRCCDSTRCIDINYPSIANGVSNEYHTLEKPIRVIDIKKTLEKKKGIHFLKPQSWSFHVLSHTWSASVRKLSIYIGNFIKALPNLDKDAYNQAFEKQSFDKDPTCYNQLLDIFEMLHADGVNLIWFDALCINQTSKDEKSHEINNMGSYFSLSSGTYVLTQGVGKVNGMCVEKMNDADGVDDLPRWFTRVWTFQEFLLPKTLTFPVEGGIDQKFMALVNCLIQEKKQNGFCKCFLDMPTEELDDIFMQYFTEEDLLWIGGFELRNAKWKSIVQIMEERMPRECTYSDDTHADQHWSIGPTHYGYRDVCKECDTKTNKKYQRDMLHEMMQKKGDIHLKGGALSCNIEKSIICCKEICKVCGSRPMIRRATLIAKHEEATYFVDREVFLGLMQCHSRMANKAPQDNHQEEGATEAIQALRGLYCAWATEGNWRPCHVICEVGWRQCTEEEDRVLGILSLLGVRLKQLRTNKRLRDQLLELAKAGGSAMLVELCLLSEKGSRLPGMSWAPDFHGRNRKLEHISRPRLISILIEHLDPDGQLQVRVKMACGRVEPHGQGSQYHLMLHNSICDNPDTVGEERHTKTSFSLMQNFINDSVEQRPIKTLQFEFKQDATIQLHGAFEVPINNDLKSDGEVSFLVRLLLLGEDEVGRNLFLICIPEKISSHEYQPLEKLHKVGSLAIETMPITLQSMFDSSKMLPCIIGGFGEDLSEYICFH